MHRRDSNDRAGAMRGLAAPWLLVLGLCACTGAPRSWSATAHEIAFGGRVDLLDPAGPRLAWSGSRLAIRFTGSSIAIHGRDLPKHPDIAGHTWPNRLQVAIDDGPPVQVAVATGDPILFERRDLAPGEHRLEVLKQSEALVGEVQILGLELGPGARLLPAAPPPARRIELIGDSLTAGYGDEGAGPACAFSSDTESVARAYPMLVARALGADVSIVAWSGRGVIRNVNAPPGAETMPRLYDRTLPERADSRWDFQRWVPAVVVVNLGANDFATGVPDARAFGDAYAAFIAGVRSRYPQARIVIAIGPLVSDDWPAGERRRTFARQYATDLVEHRRAAGDRKIDFVEFDAPARDDGLGCDYHPSVKTHRTMATLLVARLRELEGW